MEFSIDTDEMRFNKSDAFGVPVLFLIFNRLNTSQQVFEVIRKISPQKLYIASDGPRSNRSGEKEKVEAVREYVLKSIDWNCEIKTLFRNKNLGCGRGVSQAITWFFEHVDEGIILEDDCVPSLSFFPYCEELLKKFRFNNQIYHIAGNNPLTLTKTLTNDSYYFARIQHCWGWASWKRAWRDYSFIIKDLDNFVHNNCIKKIFYQKTAQRYWLDIFRKMSALEIDTWDYQWTYAIFKNTGICINPTKNLVSNIGFSNEATHTLDSNSIYNNQERYEITKIRHPKKIEINTFLLSKINRISFGITNYQFLKNKIMSPIKHVLKVLKRKIFR